MNAQHRQSTTRRRRTGQVLRCAGVVGIVAVVFLVPARSSATLAAWSDSEYGTSTMTALTVPAPQATATCVLSPGLLGATPQITINWQFAPTGPAYTVPTNVQYGYVTNGLLEPVLTNLLGNVTTTAATPGYKTVFASGLLAGLLGGNMVAGIRALDASGWTSQWLIATASMGALGANPVCAMSTTP